VNRSEDKDSRDFVRDVLESTSGSPCRRALELLPDLTDGRLASVDRQLVQQHLEHCGGCRAVAMAMSRLGEDLTTLAVLDPGPEFTAAVVARTSGQTEAARERRRDEVAGHGPAGFMDRVGRWWQERIFAPGFAVQAAYVATVLVVALVTVPISPLHGTPGKVLDAVQASPGGMPLVGPAVAWSTRQVDARTSRALDRLGAGLDTAWQDTRDDWNARSARSAADRHGCGASLDGALDELMGGRPTSAGAHALAAYRSGKAAWSAWWTVPTNSSEAVGP